MEVIIHRGTHQIGGCATEYRTKTTRIFIDFGAELDSENAKPFDIVGVTKGKTKSHTHIKHVNINLNGATAGDFPNLLQISKSL